MADITAAPGATIHDEFAAAASGLVGTLKVAIYQGDTPISAFTTSGINETGALGIYTAALTAPSVAGDDYIIVWSLDGSLDPEQLFTSSLVVTGDIAAVGGTSNLYVTEDEVKAAATLLGETFADGDLDIIRPAVCRAIDAYKKTIFYPQTGVRYYTPDRGARHLPIYDLNTLTSVEVDSDGDGDWETEWTRDTDFYLEPANAGFSGRPYNRVCLNQYASPWFPTYRNSVKITGSWGWAETPAEVKLAAEKLCVRELAILRNAPTGIVIAADVAVRIGSVYRDIAYLLDNLNPRPQVASLKAG